MSEPCEYTVRPATREDMAGMLQLITEEGRETYMQRLLFQFNRFPEGSFVAESSEGEIISLCTFTVLDDTYGCIYSYITKKSYRRRGIGSQVFYQCRRALGSRNICINAAWNRQEMYTAKGFKWPSFTMLWTHIPIRDILPNNVALPHNISPEIFPINDKHFAKIMEYDRNMHPMERADYIERVLKFGLNRFVAIDKDEVKGWGALYGHQGKYCLTLYSDSPDVAKALIYKLLNEVASEPETYIEVFFPEDNADALKLFSAAETVKLRRMYTQRDIPVPTHLVYGFLSCDGAMA